MQLNPFKHNQNVYNESAKAMDGYDLDFDTNGSLNLTEMVKVMSKIGVVSRAPSRYRRLFDTLVAAMVNRYHIPLEST